MPKVAQLTQLLTTILPTESSVAHSQNLLLFGCGNGTLAAYLANLVTSGQVWSTDSNASSINLTLKTSQANDLHNLHVFPDLADPESYLRDPPANPFDTAIIILPKGRKVSRRWLLQAYQCLCDTGILYLAGANDEGIQAVAKDASELFGQAVVLGYKKGTRLYRIIKQSTISNLPDWTQQPGIASGTWNEFHIEVRNRDFTIHTLPGVFSFDQLDEGTRLLLECLQIPTGSRILDMGCGCGIIGMLAVHLGAGHVDLVDDHLLSVASTLENLRLNGISSASVYASDLYSGLPDMKYDMVLSNPPFHIGKEVNYQIAQTLISNGYQKLNPGGSLLIVANRFIRYERLMHQIFHNVKILQESGKFHVLSSQKV